MRLPIKGSKPSAIAVLLLLAILVVRVVVSLTYTPDVTLDQSGYEASAYRLVRAGTFAYPRGDDVWSVDDGVSSVTEAGRTRFLSKPRNAYTMPGYPAFRAALYMLVGDGERWRAVTRVAQAVLSAVGALLMYLLARRFSERAGIIALVISLVYQPLATANSFLLTDTVFTYLVVGTVYSLVLLIERPGYLRAGLAGLLLGVALWVRPTIAPWALVSAAVVIAFRLKGMRRILPHLVVYGAITLLVISPWWIRNYQLYNRCVPWSTSGNFTALEAIRIDAAHQWPFPWETSGPAQTPEQSAIEESAAERIRSGTLGTDASDLAQSDAYGREYGRLRAEVLRRYPSTVLVSRGRSILTALAVPYAQVQWFRYLNPLTAVLHLCLLTASAAAAWTFRRRMDAVLLASVPLYLIALHSVIIPFNRYVFPAMPFVVVLAASMIDMFVSRFASVPSAQALPGDVRTCGQA